MIAYFKAFLQCFGHPGDFVMVANAGLLAGAVVNAGDAVKLSDSFFKLAKFKYAAVEDVDVMVVFAVLVIAVR